MSYVHSLPKERHRHFDRPDLLRVFPGHTGIRKALRSVFNEDQQG
jgi:hypothetical protein